jgi:hypothetical protein
MAQAAGAGIVAAVFVDCAQEWSIDFASDVTAGGQRSGFAGSRPGANALTPPPERLAFRTEAVWKTRWVWQVILAHLWQLTLAHL